MTDTLLPDGVDQERLARLGAAIEADIAAERYDGAVVHVARRGTVLLHEAFGFAERATARPMRRDSVVYTASMAKHLTNAVVLQRIDRGEIGFTTRVAEVIPEYARKGKGATTVADLLVHRAGLPFFPSLPPQVLADSRALAAAACDMLPESPPGTTVSYAAIVAHSVLAELVRRLDGGHRTFTRIVAEDLLAPLGMTDTCLGSRADLADRRVPVVFRDRRPGLLDPDAVEAVGNIDDPDLEIPAAAALTTAADFHRFAEACRRGGELDGTRILGPAVLRTATTNATGDLPNNFWSYTRGMREWPQFPAYLSPGFYLRGDGVFPHAFGVSSSPGTFGGIGGGSNVFWVDPQRELTYVFLSSGLLEESYSWERHQRLSDLAHSAILD